MMKKLFLSLAALLCCALTATVFTSCGDDDDNNTPATKKIVGYEITYNVNLHLEQFNDSTGNLFSLCDTIEIGYNDADGNEQREVIQNGKWTKTVDYKATMKNTLTLYLKHIPEQLNPQELPYKYYRYYISRNMYLPNEQDFSGIRCIYEDGSRQSGSFSKIVITDESGSTTMSKEKALGFLENSKRANQGFHLITIKLSI